MDPNCTGPLKTRAHRAHTLQAAACLGSHDYGHSSLHDNAVKIKTKVKMNTKMEIKLKIKIKMNYPRINEVTLELSSPAVLHVTI